MARLPIPDFLVMSLALGSVALIMGSGVRWGVGRKARTIFHAQTFMEDSVEGNQTRYRVVTRAEETGGESFTIELLIREGAYGHIRSKPGSQPPHMHLHQDEHIEVKQGRLGYWRGAPSLEAVIGPDDDDAIIAPGEAHTLWNAGGEGGGDLLLEITFRPAGKGEAFYETLAGLGYDYETAQAVSPLQRLLCYARADAVLTDLPPWAWRLAEEWLIPLADGLGYKATYPQYSTRAPQGASAGELLEGGKEFEEDD